MKKMMIALGFGAAVMVIVWFLAVIFIGEKSYEAVMGWMLLGGLAGFALAFLFGRTSLGTGWKALIFIGGVATFVLLGALIHSPAIPSEPLVPFENGDVPQILQATLNAKELDPYFHETAPARKPLNVLFNDVVLGTPHLMKFGQPVQFRGDPGKEPVFVFNDYKIQENTATVDFTYAAEGIHGTTTLKKTGKQWTVKSCTLTEN